MYVCGGVVVRDKLYLYIYSFFILQGDKTLAPASHYVVSFVHTQRIFFLLA